MQIFGIGKDKFQQITEKRQAKLIAQWFRRLWLELQRGGSFNPESFQNEYRQVCQWRGLTRPPIGLVKRGWLEFIADEYHFWLQEQGKRLQEEDFLPAVPWGDQLTEQAWVASYDYWVALDGLRSAFNLGSICRLVDGLGFQGIITSGITPSLTHPKVKKTSLGAETWIPEERTEDLVSHLRQKQSQGYALIGLERAEGSIPLQDFTWPDKAVILLGNEEYGLSQDFLELADHLVNLPMQGRKNSLNVATAFAGAAFNAVLNIKKSC